MPSSTATTTSSWDYYKDRLWAICRNSRITAPTAPEKAALITFLKAICDNIAATGTRYGWLRQRFYKKATASAGADDYQGDLDDEPVWVLVELLGVVARDFVKIEPTDAEITLSNTLIAATGNRQYGVTPYFGSVAGAAITLP